MPARSLFPPAPLADVRVLADTIARSGSGQPMRRLDIFHELERSADSGAGRNLVTASGGFGLTAGGYSAVSLTLTELGRRLAVGGDETAAIEAVLHVDVFRQFYETYANTQLPSEIAARSYLATQGIPADRTQACLDLIVQNGRYVGLIAERSGTEYVLSREHAEDSAERPVRQDALVKQSEGNKGKQTQIDIPTPMPVPTLHINIEIHLPNDQTPEVYDAIFGSMRKHLIDTRAVAESD